MTNEMIILSAALALMEEGRIKGTGNTFEIDGKEYEEPEPIHTYNTWKEYGRQVKKGEKAICSLMIWKHTTKQTEDGEQRSRMFRKRAYFFTAGQTEAATK